MPNCKLMYRLYTFQTKGQGEAAEDPSLTAPLAVPTGFIERWSLEFFHDRFGGGIEFRAQCRRQLLEVCVGRIVDASIFVNRVVRELDRMIEMQCAPQTIVIVVSP